MKVKKLFVVLAILALALPFAAWAADSDVTVEVTGGIRSIVAPTAFDCNTKTFSFSEQSGTCVGTGGAGASGGKYEVQDLTFDGLGSHMVIQGIADFEGVDPLNTFSIENFAIMINPANIGTVEGDAVTPPTVVTGFDTWNDVTMAGVSPLTAGAGEGGGIYNVYVETLVTIPASQAVDAYTASIASAYLSGP